jgi:MarR family transcriptional regulator, transcriptional regulator for hemolysin
MNDLDRDLGFLLHDVARLMRKRFEQNAHDLGLTRSQGQVLVHLANNEGIHQGALAEKLDVEPITLTRILDRLEEAGLIERLLYRQDRRVRLLRLTPAAHPLIDAIFAVGAMTRDEAMAGVADEDRDRLFDILARMKVNLTGNYTAVRARGMRGGTDHDR